jgi:VWFA-related protein
MTASGMLSAMDRRATYGVSSLAVGMLAAGLAAAQTPVLRTRVDLTRVIFLAVAPDGRPVPDLKPDEVAIRVNNRDRKLASLEFVRLAGASIGADAVPRPLPQPYGSNRLLDAGRTVLLLLAHESISAGKERPVKEAARRFIATLSPRDRVALVLIPRGRVDVDFTTDHARVLERLERFVGQAPQNPSESDVLCRTRLTLGGTADLLNSLGPLDGAKTVVFIASGLMPPKRDGTMGARVLWAPGACELQARDFDAVGVAAGLAAAQFYVVQPEDLRIDSGRPPTDGMTRQAPGGPPDPGRRAFSDPSASRFARSDDELHGLQNLAGVTGGEMFRLTSISPDAVFARVARESSGYYLAAFEPDAAERNGQPHRLEVRVAREHVLVRAGGQIQIGRNDEDAPPTPQAVLASPAVRRSLPLRITAYPSRDPSNGGVRILAVAESLDPSAKLTGAAVGVFGPEGRLVARTTIPPGELRAATLLAAIPVSPGPYRVRVAAIDDAARSGTADYEIDARLGELGPLRASGLALGTAVGGSLEARLEFVREPAAVAYLELYGPLGRRGATTVSVEIGETLDGPPLGTLPAQLTTSKDDPSRHIVTAVIPLGGLLPGDFIVRAVVSIDGKVAGRTVRTLRKAVSNR